MTSKDNFKWLVGDINSTLVLKVIYVNNGIEKAYGIFDIDDVLETPCDKLEIDVGNINDLTNLLTLGVVRFVNIRDRSDILEIPFRKLYLLYKNANILGEENRKELISFSAIEAFSVIDGTIKNDLLVDSFVVNEPSEDLKRVMEIACEYGSYGMHEKIIALGEVDTINYRRLLSEIKDRNSR